MSHVLGSSMTAAVVHSSSHPPARLESRVSKPRSSAAPRIVSRIENTQSERISRCPCWLELQRKRRDWKSPLKQRWGCSNTLKRSATEAVAGHRSRVVQGTAEGDRGEDAALAGHHALAAQLGRWETWLRAGLPRAWLLAGLGALAPAAGGTAATPGRLAASLGGLLLAQDR